MSLSNFERMILLAEEVFDAKNDPDQLDVDQEVIARLQRLHHASVAEHDDGKGPVAWVLLVPTTEQLMHQFLEKKLSERELFESTPPDIPYEAVYLCSAMVLPEYRRQGITKQLSLDAIETIRKDHPIRALFVWTFSTEGDLSAERIAHHAALPLYKR